MTRKVYKSAMGKTIDLGSLMLQNEHVRAVGNMNVNARGDTLDSSNKVIDKKNKQVQRQHQKTTTNVTSSAPVYASSRSAKESVAKNKTVDTSIQDAELLKEFDQSAPVEEITPVAQPDPVPEAEIPAVGGGLAAAIARSRVIKQEKEKTLREKQQAQGLRKI